MNSLIIALILGLMPSSAPGAQGRFVAQAGDTEGVNADRELEKKAAPKKPTKKAAPKTEADLWSMPEEKDDEPADVEEVPAEDVEDIDPKRRPDEDAPLGDEQRDSWGDEKRIKDQPDLVDDPEKARPVGRPGPDKPRPDKIGNDVGATDKPLAGAQDPDERGRADGGTESARPGEQPEPALGVAQQIVGLSGSLADLNSLWQQRQIHLKQRDLALAEDDLNRFVALKEELRIRNTFLESNVLLREAERALKAEEPEKAEALLAVAIRLSPDMVSAYLARASFLLSVRPTALAELLGNLVDGAQAAWQEPFTLNRVKTNAIMGILLGLVLAAVLFVLVQFLAYLRLFLHDFHHLFPRGAARFQTAVLALMLLALPLMFRLGLVMTLLIWLLVAWLYQNWRERIISVMVLVLLGATPFIVRYGMQGLVMPESASATLLRVERAMPDDEQVSRIKSLLAEHPEHTGLLAVLGNHYKRQGDYETAAKVLLRGLDTKPASAVLLNNLGNVHFLQGDMGKAVGMYVRATMAQPELAIPHFNLSQTHYRAGESDKGAEARQKALRLDRPAIRLINDKANTGQVNFVVAELELPEEWLLGASKIGVSETKIDKATAALWLGWGGRGDPFSFWIVAAGILGIFGLALWLVRRLSLSQACVRCGRPACRRCNNELKDDSHCGQCYYAFVRKEQIDAKARISKEIQIRQYKRRHESLACGLSFVLPGVGQMLKERTFRGMLILPVFTLVLVQILLGPGLMRDPLSFGGGLDWLKLIPLLLLFVAFYVWALVDVFRSDDG